MRLNGISVSPRLFADSPSESIRKAWLFARESRPTSRKRKAAPPPPRALQKLYSGRPVGVSSIGSRRRHKCRALNRKYYPSHISENGACRTGNEVTWCVRMQRGDVVQSTRFENFVNFLNSWVLIGLLDSMLRLIEKLYYYLLKRSFFHEGSCEKATQLPDYSIIYLSFLLESLMLKMKQKSFTKKQLETIFV